MDGRMSLTEKYKLKIDNQRNVLKKLQKVFRDKQGGESIHAVDFEQLKIENCQLLKEIRSKNTELISAKTSTSKLIQVREPSFPPSV